MSSYRFSSDASRDVEDIALYIFDLNPVAADHFLTGLEETCELLAAHPLVGRA
jgi:plasmid stabilization system protein ParE